MIQVVKRDGSKEPLDLEKFHKVVQEACSGLTGVSPSEVEIKSKIQFYDNIKTSDIQETLIKAAAELISEDSPNYQYVAGRLVSYHLRKQVYGKYDPDKLFSHYKRIRDLGFYTDELGNSYSEEDWGTLNRYIDHSRDEHLTFIAMEQFRGKYLVRNRYSKEILETPQMAFMLIAMTLFMSETDNRLKWVKDFYDALSQFDVSLPSPIMAGVRTPEKQFSSCVLIDCDDSLDSINATAGSVVKYVSKKAGIGIGATKIRALDDLIRNGAVTHTGVVPFIKHFESAVNSCSQGGLRKGSATINLLFWHLEIEDLLVLKNNKGTEETRARHLDYVIQLNRVMYERLLSNGNITLFSPKDHPEMYEAYYTDVDKFRELYEKAERSRCRKKVVKAIDLFTSLMQERMDTGRIYIMNVDNCNDHGAYLKDVAPIYQTNLCVEITEHNKPLKHVFDGQGEIALCTLAAINLGKIKQPSDFERPAKLLVRGLDNLLSYQDYLLPAAENCGRKRRSLGIGIINLAYWLAKNDMTYSNHDLQKIHEFCEAYSYYIIKSSVDLAKERGACELNHESSYSKGNLPIDTYSKNLDLIVEPTYKMDWQGLTSDLVEYGIRNYPLMAGMPAETSAAVSNSTNGFEPVLSLITTKVSKDLQTKQVVPEIRRLKNKYELKWDMTSNKGYLDICSVFQKFMDQAISVNTNYNPSHYDNTEVPMSVMIQDLVYFYKNGGKCLYYCNTYDGAGEIDIKNEEDCDSCKI